MSTLSDILSSKVKAEVFRLLFGPRDQALHLREMERQSGLALGTVRQELERLTRTGLVTTRVDGNRRLYAANKQHPLYPDIRNIVLKTTGLADILHEALADLPIRVAFVFGSIARQEEQAHSDVDLMVIGSIGLRQLTKSLASVSDTLGREINPHILSEQDFAHRRKSGDHFLTTVLDAPRLFVIGSDDELEAMGS